MSAVFWLTEALFARLEPLFPADARGVARVDDRRVISGIVLVLMSGCRCKNAPAIFDPRMTLYNRFARLAEKGIWRNAFEALTASGGPPAEIMLDSIHAKTHRRAAGARRKSRPSSVEWTAPSRSK